MWMTSASKMFHSRRYRFGLCHNFVDVLGFNYALADASSSSSSSHQHRTIHHRHNHHHSSQNIRRQYLHDDGCEPATRRIHDRRLDHPEQNHLKIRNMKQFGLNNLPLVAS